MAVSEQTDSLRVLGSDPVRAPPTACAATLKLLGPSPLCSLSGGLHMCVSWKKQHNLIVPSQGCSVQIPPHSLALSCFCLGHHRQQPARRWTTW